MPGGSDPGRVLDRGRAARQVFLDRRGAQSELQPVTMPVQGDHMTRRGDPRRKTGSALDLLTDKKKCGPSPRALEQVEHRRRALGVRAVVEGQRDATAAGQRAREPQRPGSARHNRGEGREGRKAREGREGVADHTGMIADGKRSWSNNGLFFDGGATNTGDAATRGRPARIEPR